MTRRHPGSSRPRLPQLQRYPDGIPIEDEADLKAICRRERVSLVVFAYSDVTYAHVMTLASRALALGADFTLLGPERTMLRAPVPVVAVSAVRTGCGKSPIARWLATRLRAGGRRVAVVRHPMPYGDLKRQRAQRFATSADLDAAGCTIEEREEYEPHLAAGSVVFAGVDYAEILARAGAESDVLVSLGTSSRTPASRRSRPSWIDGWLGPARPSEARPPHLPRRAPVSNWQYLLADWRGTDVAPTPQSSVSSHNHQEESGP